MWQAIDFDGGVTEAEYSKCYMRVRELSTNVAQLPICLGRYGSGAVARLETGSRTLSSRKLGVEAIRLWLFIGMRLGVMKDIRRLIAAMLATSALLVAHPLPNLNGKK